MSAEKDRLARELVEVVDLNFRLIKAAFPQVTGEAYHRALARVETAYRTWKVAK
jgi:hypothetical protein